MTLHRKKLIEVALPLEAINLASAREKSIRHGHPSTLHLWWARRPLAACRAVLFAQLVDDPGSRPEEFPTDEAQEKERQRLFRLIEELVLWENTNNEAVLQRARAEIARSVALRKLDAGELANIMERGRPAGEERGGRPARKEPLPCDRGVPARATSASFTVRDLCARQADPESVNAFLAEHAPPVLDPFCGGGSIPLEAQRLGLRAYASDLNPVAVLITKALIEIPPKFASRPPVNPHSPSPLFGARASRPLPDAGGTPALPGMWSEGTWRGAQGLAEDVRYYGQWMRDEAEKRIGYLYPKVKVTQEMTAERPDLKPYVGQELTVIAWLWARTVICPNPACGARMPLVRSFALSTKRGKEAWVQPVVEGKSEKEKGNSAGGTPALRFEVRTGKGTPPEGTVNRRGARCVACDSPVPFDHVRSEGRAGRMGAQLMAIVAEGQRGRVYLAGTDEQVEIAQEAKPEWTPSADLPHNPRDFKTPNYMPLYETQLLSIGACQRQRSRSRKGISRSQKRRLKR